MIAKISKQQTGNGEGIEIVENKVDHIRKILLFNREE
jgi:hypothetical protein